MNCDCNCFGIAASSKRPVKRYNLLVPDIFDGTPPVFGEELEAGTQRKIKKLAEYVEKNPHRGPKVRLTGSRTRRALLIVAEKSPAAPKP